MFHRAPVIHRLQGSTLTLAGAATDRPIRFLMYQAIYNHPMMKPFAKIAKVIPISSEQHPREMLHSLKTASDALRNDEIVCIFAEGQITRTGQLLPFRRGMERWWECCCHLQSAER
jgi:acyl-[acyl-carrier-protein]-phospholipid O-acyltransferase/long-chain-fatty-acid--[acyl-carrier-protein] ligase